MKEEEILKIRKGRMSKKAFGLLIGISLGLLPVVGLAGNGTIQFEGDISFYPWINQWQNINLDMPDRIMMDQNNGAGIYSSIWSPLIGTATGVGSGVMRITASTLMESTTFQGFDGLMGAPLVGGAVRGGLASGVMSLKTSLGGGHEVILTLP